MKVVSWQASPIVRAVVANRIRSGRNRSATDETDEPVSPGAELELEELRRRLEIIEYVAAIGELSISELAAELSERSESPFADDYDQVLV